MRKQLRLFWLRESGCDAGTPVDAEELDAPLRERVIELAGNDSAIDVHLPFLDRREWRRRAEILRNVKLERSGNLIRTVPATRSAELRDRAATLVALDPSWQAAPGEFDSRYFRVWQNVSMAVQAALRRAIPELYFRDAARYEDRPDAYPLIVYEASRLCFGRPRTEFTYDVADPEALPLALRMIGRAMQDVLARVERRLLESGRPELARRYLPVWHQDVVNEVKRRPQPLLALLAQEAALVNAVIDLGTVRQLDAVKPFAKTVNAVLRRIHGQDMRELGPRVLDEATRVLAGSDRAKAA